MREFWKFLRTIVLVTGLVSLSAAIGVWGWLALTVYQDTKSVTKSVSQPFKDMAGLIRALRGSHRHDERTKADISRLSTEDHMFAVMIAKDSEGELPLYRREVMEEEADAVLRLKNLGVSIPEIFRKAFLWMPLDWDHTKNARVRWFDRILDRTEDDSPSDVLEQAIEIVMAKKGTNPDSRKCAVHVIRPMDHNTTWWSGELKARDVIRKMREDPILKDKPYKTRFFCGDYSRKR